jgi:xanthine dehydrogenase accessory factor
MSEFLNITQIATEALERGETVCLATVVRVRGSAPRHASAKMLVWPDGETFGTVGGGTYERQVIEDARLALQNRQPAFKNYVFDTRGGPDSVGLCGGSVDVYLDILRPDSTLILIGAGHIAQPLAQMAALLEMRIVVVDDREEWVNQERFPQASEIFVIDYDPVTEILSPIPVAITPASYVIIATWGYDLPALEQVLAAKPAYIGLVASQAKAREFFKRLMSKGIPAEVLRHVQTPVGLDIGAESPAELALSILAEVLAIQRGGSGKPLREIKGEIIDKSLARGETRVSE